MTTRTLNLKNPLWGHLLLFVAAAFWGGNAPMVKELDTFGVSAVAVAAFRSIGAAAAFWLTSLAVRRPQEHIGRVAIGKLFVAAVLSIVFNQMLFTVGISFTSPVNATIVATMLPIITMILSALILKERITVPKLAGIAIGLTGALMLVLAGGKGPMGGGIKGDLMCLTAQTCIGLYMVLFRGMIHRYNVITLMKWMFLFSSLIVTPLTWPYISAIDYASLPLVAWAEIAFIVFGGTYAAYIFFTYGQQLLTPTVVGMYNYVQPIVATILAVAMGVGLFGWREGVAMVLVFVGVYIVNNAKKIAAYIRKR